MVDASLVFALTTGMIAAFNPCGFAMLPAYLGYFLGLEGASEDVRGSVPRALAVGAAVSGGFAVVFGIAGILVIQLRFAVERHAPWLTLGIGILMALLGVAMLRGFEPKVALPRLQRGGSSRGIGSMAVFGVSYATVSLSCTLPVFLAATAGTFEAGGFLGGLAVFGAYALGMGLVLTALTVALALAQRRIVRRARRILPYVNRAGGALLLLAGVYVAYYGSYALRTRSGAPSGSAPIDAVAGAGGRVIQLVERVGSVRIALVLGVGLVVALAASLMRQRAHARTAATEPSDFHSARTVQGVAGNGERVPIDRQPEARD